MSAAGDIDDLPDGLRAAITYARRGWPVAPAHSPRRDRSCSCGDASCDRVGKHPRTRRGLTDATTDEKTIREWWAQWPDANVLIRTGKVGDRYLVALDVDLKHNGEESLARVLNENSADLPDTPRAITGGGGAHVFMWSKHPIKSSVGSHGGIAPGVDVRGVGGYVIAAPSRHETGREYTWDVGAHPADTPLAEAPSWFVAVAGLAGERVKIKPSDVEGADISEIFEGGRNHALTKIAGSMRRPGVGERAILAALRIVNEERCKPPLDDWEVEKIARSIARCEAGDPVKGSDPLPLVSWVEVAAPRPPVKWTIEELGITYGAVTIIGGAGGGGKTMALQAMLVAIASGRPVWGQFPVQQGRGVHIDYEQGDRITATRYQRIANAMGVELLDLPRDSFALATLPRFSMKADQATEDTIARVCTDARVAVIDAFRGAFPEARENDSDVRKHLDMLQHASERTGCAIIVIAHSRKITEKDNDPRSSLRGSSALYDAAQTVYMLDGENGRPTRVHNTKDRVVGGIDGKLRETFGIKVRDVSGVNRDNELDRRWGLDVSYVSTPDLQAAYLTSETEKDEFAASADRLVTAANRIVTHLQACPEGVTLIEIRAFCSIAAADANAVMTGLVRDGKVSQEGRGTQALYRLTQFIGSPSKCSGPDGCR